MLEQFINGALLLVGVGAAGSIMYMIKHAGEPNSKPVHPAERKAAPRQVTAVPSVSRAP